MRRARRPFAAQWASRRMRVMSDSHAASRVRSSTGALWGLMQMSRMQHFLDDRTSARAARVELASTARVPSWDHGRTLANNALCALPHPFFLRCVPRRGRPASFDTRRVLALTNVGVVLMESKFGRHSRRRPSRSARWDARALGHNHPLAQSANPHHGDAPPLLPYGVRALQGRVLRRPPQPRAAAAGASGES